MTDTAKKTAARPKNPPSGPGVGVGDAGRSVIVTGALGEFGSRSYYVTRVDADGKNVGQERTINATLDEYGVSIVGAEIIVNAVVYDANKPEVGRPVRLVLTPDDARKLAADLAKWSAALSPEAS